MKMHGNIEAKKLWDKEQRIVALLYQIIYAQECNIVGAPDGPSTAEKDDLEGRLKRLDFARYTKYLGD